MPSHVPYISSMYPLMTTEWQWLKAFPQTSHSLSFSPVWIHWCCGQGKTTAGRLSSHITFEHFLTVSAIERALSSMEMVGMRDKEHVTPEGCGEWFASVTSLMLSKRWALSKGISTILTFMGFLFSMKLVILYQVCWLLEGLYTCLTCKLFLPSLCSMMLSKVVTLLKHFPYTLHPYDFSPVWILWWTVVDEQWVRVFSVQYVSFFPE